MNFPRALQYALEKELSTPIVSFQAASGGDINHAFRLETAPQFFFLKYNQYPQGASMLQTEAQGLTLLASAQAIAIPKVMAQGSVGKYHFLLLEDWTGYQANTDFWENFGASLASLHQHSQSAFGLEHDNFIASLSQSNQRQNNWANFYWQERIAPLARQARDKQVISTEEHQSFDYLQKRLSDIFPASRPALLHGDLWSGNYLIGPGGQAGLIDPSVYYGHREIDLAMTRLFGGFPDLFHESYNEAYPLDNNWEERVPLCQLYPLLVHLHLFGRDYWGAIQRVLNRYR